MADPERRREDTNYVRNARDGLATVSTDKKDNKETSHQSIRQLGTMDKCLERCQVPKLLQGVTGKMNRSMSVKETGSGVNNS